MTSMPPTVAPTFRYSWRVFMWRLLLSTQETNSISDVYTGTYYMTAHIHITDGATLEIDGNDQGEEGGCKILLLVNTAVVYFLQGSSRKLANAP